MDEKHPFTTLRLLIFTLALLTVSLVAFLYFSYTLPERGDGQLIDNRPNERAPNR